tara:strand:+ start:3884 stop:5092 length:1209 start_codon:yes stop_codon:yes gene_type:complete
MAQNRHKIPTSGYNPRTKELFFSWSSSQSSSNLPDRTISFNLEYGHASYIDHGFTAMINYQSYNQMALRDFLLEVVVAGNNASICSCDDSLTDILQGDPFVLGRTASFTDNTCDTTNTSTSVDCDSTANIKVGHSVSGSGIPSGAVVSAVVDDDTFTISSAATATASDVTLTFKTSAYPSLWKTEEDTGSCSLSQYTDEWNCVANNGTWTATTADTASLCSKLDGARFGKYCEGGTEGSTFVLASAEDYFLKEYNTDYYSRNMHTPVAGQAAIYDPVGYESILESGAMHFETDNEKTLQRITLEYSGITSDSVTAVMKFGKANQPDLLLTGAAYTALTEQELLSYQSSASTSDIDGNLISPDDKAYFNNYTRGRYIGYQLKLTGAGAATLSRLTLSTRLAEK